MAGTWTRRDFLRTAGVAGVSLGWTRAGQAAPAATPRPNILWITSEDNSPLLGCYGDPLAHTPNLDALAAEGVRYTRAFANAPVCSAARSTLILGMYPVTVGLQHHRSRYPVPAAFRPYPEYLREAGYYCTNNSKTDYNFTGNPRACWDDCGNKAHYRNRKDGQPFFAIFNLTESHESSVFPPAVAKKRQSRAFPPTPRIDPVRIPLPPYHPDEKGIRQEWADYYDAVSAMDARVGDILKELRDSGLAEDTIVFYYSDHGGVLARSKRFVYDTGTHVPLIIRFPAKFRALAPADPGSVADRLVSFVDFPATLFSLAEVPVPDHMQGTPFLGRQAGEENDRVFLFRGRMDARHDMVRAVRTKRYRYIRNFTPYRPYGQPYTYADNSRATPAWREAYVAGRCDARQRAYWEMKPPEELYEIEADPWEVANLAASPEHADLLSSLQRACDEEILRIGDTGFVPEAMFKPLTGDGTLYDYARGADYPLARILETAKAATAGDEAALPALAKALKDPHPVMRYWGAVGGIVLGPRAATCREAYRDALADAFANVRIAAAEALARCGDPAAGVAALARELESRDDISVVYAVNALQYMDRGRVAPLKPRLQAIAKEGRVYKNAARAAAYLAENLPGPM